MNIFAEDGRCPGENFLQAFNTVRGGGNSCLINLLFTGDGTDNAGTAAFVDNEGISTTLDLGETGGSVGTAARIISQLTSGGQQMIASTIGNPSFFQAFPQFTGRVNVLDSNDYSRYNGLEVILKRRFRKGFGYQIGYTWSMSKDSRSFDPTFSTVSRSNSQSGSSTPFDINNRRLNYAWSDFDRRHMLQATYVWEVPIGRGRKLGSDMSKALDYLIGGWQLSGTYVWASGRPFTVYSGIYTVSNVNQALVNCDSCPRNIGSLVERNGTNYWFSEEADEMFTQPKPGEFGNSGRNFFIGPRQFQTDVSLMKKFKFTETLSFDLRVDARNLTNNASFGLPTATFTSSSFGRIRDSVTSFSRRIQFSGKFNF